MLESYLSPYLLSYVNKYIKNIKPEDLQVSLWGGDLILAKLDLNLAVLENELGNLPLTFLSGHIHELKVHIPWTALGSEPAVITINTIQFVVKLRDAATGDGKSESTVSSKEEDGEPNTVNQIQKSKSGSELTPGYIQSLTRRIINNAHVIISNLILKYVEEDIVLSVNVKSVETFAVNEVWEKAFIELALPELVLRRLCMFSDVTVCLDKRNASGKIEVYQEPVIFHSNLVTRIHMTFNSLNARFANIIKVNTFSEELHLSLTETQLPMFIRLLQLVLALYYGTLDLPESGLSEGEATVPTSSRNDQSLALTAQVNSESEQNQEGWAGWAWSFVPEVLSYDEGEEEEPSKQRQNEDSILSFGFYCQEGSFTFKLNDITSTPGPFSTSRNLNVQPFLRASGYGMSLEVLMQGLSFFSTQVGISHMSLQGLANCTCGVDDFNITLDNDRDILPFITCGTRDVTGRETNYLTGSLFDPVCPENLRQRGRYILDQEKHHEAFIEEYGAARFGAFWSDYVFTMTPLEDLEGSDSGGSNSSSVACDPIFDWKELSWKKFVLYPCQVTISSSLVHRLQQLVFSAQNHEYEPYSQDKPEIVDDNRPVPTREQVAALEEHVPSRSTQFSLLDMNVKFLLAEHPPFTAGPNTLCAISDKEPPTSLFVNLLPSMNLTVKRVGLQTTVPMYPRRLVKAVSKLLRPSSDLLYHSCSHIQFKVFGVEVGLTQMVIGHLPQDQISRAEKSLVHPISAAAYQKKLALPVYWSDPSQLKTEIQLELPKLRMTFTKPDVLMISHLCNSWLSPSYESDWLFETTLIDDVFGNTESNTPSMDVSVTGVDVSFNDNQQVWAVSGSLQQMHVTLKDDNSLVPVMEGPVTRSCAAGSQVDTEWSLISFTVQMKTNDDSDDGLSVVFLDVHGMAFCFDPALFPWTVYQPRPKTFIHATSSEQPFHHMMSQENQGSSSSQRKLLGQGERLASPTEVQSAPEDMSGTNTSKLKKQLLSLSKTLQKVVIQVNVKPCILIIPTKPVQQRVSQRLTDLLTTSSSSSQHLLAIRTPSVSVLSSGHHNTDLMGEIPLGREALPQGPGSTFPWAVKAKSFEIFTISDSSPHRMDLLEPLSIASTVAFNCDIDKDSGVESVGIVVHTDMPGVQINCSHEQIELLKEQSNKLLVTLPEMRDSFGVRPKWLSKGPSRMSRTVSTATTRSLTRSSGTSSEHLIDAAGTLSSPLESVSHEDIEEDDLPDPSSVRLSFWIQWTVDKAGARLITRTSPATGKRVKLCMTSEDFTTSIDYQDVFSKVTCKVGALNIRHFEQRPDKSWSPGCYSGILFTSSHIFTKSLESASTTPRSPNPSKTRSLMRKSEHKFTDSKQSHGFFSFVWTRAHGSSVSRLLEGREQSEDIHVKHKHFVNEVILSIQPVDAVIWCPVIAEAMKTFQSQDTDSARKDFQAFRIQPPTPAKAKPVFHPVPRQSHHKPRTDTLSISKAPTSTVSSFDKWFTSSNLPLVYCDMKEMRCFFPVKDPSPSPVGMDVFLFKVSHIKLVPYADNPLPRMVLKKELYRKAQQSCSSQRPGALMEDRQYQLDVTSLGLYTSSWSEISRVTEEEKRSADPDVVTSQNPALEWNTSPPKQDGSAVVMNPVVEDFSVCCIAAPAITINRLNVERTASKPVIVCGHSVEGNISSDLCLYLSLNNITMAQNLMTENIGALKKCLPEQIKKADVPQSPQHRTKHRHSRADSGFDSDMSHERHSDIAASLGDFSPSGVRVVKQKYKTMVTKPPVKASGSHARKVIPFDLLFTGREMSVFLFSKEEDRVCPFLLTELSQPSLAVSVSRRKQKVEMSLYNMKVNGRISLQTSGVVAELPTATDYPVPWFETCPGEPNAKTGVRPALLTLGFTNFLTGEEAKLAEGAISVDIGRPVRGSISIDKGEQVISFAGKIRNKFRRSRQVWPQAEKLVSAAQKNPFVQGLPISEPKALDSAPVDSKGDSFNLLAMVKNIAIATAPCVVVMATTSECDGPSATFSVSGSRGNIRLHPNTQGDATDLKLKLNVSGISMETRLGSRQRPLIGPLTLDLDTAVHLQNKSFGVTKSVSHVTCAHIPVFFGQEHFNTLTDLATSYGEFFQQKIQSPVSELPRVDKPTTTPTATPVPSHSKDDLRSGSFVYITESESGPPLPNQIQFQAGGTDRDHNGTMTWHYPEPRVLTRITMTPIPLRTATNTADNDDEIDVLCSLEYWDELDCCFQHYKDLFVSETNTYHLSMGLGSIGSEGAVAASVWRMVLNPGSDESNQALLESQNVILSPMAIAASLRVDSCYSPAFIPMVSASLRCGAVDIHLENHLSQSGKGTPKRLQPFTFDGTEPVCQEFCKVSIMESSLSTQLWLAPSMAVKMKLNTSLKSSLLNYSQLTMIPLIGDLPIEGSLMIDQADGGCLLEIDVDDVNLRVGQGSLHTLINAAQSWMDNLHPEAEKVVSAYHVICNNTDVTLRLGQIDTEESIELDTRMMHAYCWRTHKQSSQMLRVCVDEPDRLCWSSPFNVDAVGTVVTAVQLNGLEQVLFMEVTAISPLQKQITFHAKQSFINHLTIPIEVHLQYSSPEQTGVSENLQQTSKDGSMSPLDEKALGCEPEDPVLSETRSKQRVPSQRILSVDAESSIPSLLVNDNDIIGFRVKLQGEESDWSEQFAVAGEMKCDKFVIEVPRPNKSSIFFCCAILEESYFGHLQRAIVLTPSYWVHNYSPNSLLMNLTCRRNPGVQTKEIQGCGTMTPLYYLNPSSPYLATFQLNSDTSPSSPPIPISFNSDLFVVVPKEQTRISGLLFKPPHMTSKESWPYSESGLSQSTSSSLAPNSFSQPDTDLNIHLSQDWSHVDSVVINVEPWCLVTNETDLDVTISDAGGKHSHIPHGTVIAPPKFQGKFYISVCHMDQESWSEWITLEEEKISPYMRADQMKHLFIDSYVTVVVPFTREETQEACYLVIQSEVKENIRVLKILPKTVILNETEQSIALMAVELGTQGQTPTDVRNLIAKNTVNPKSKMSSIFWRRFGTSTTDTSSHQLKQSISVTLVDVMETAGCQTTDERHWSKWVHVDNDNTRQPIPVPIHESSTMQFATEPWVATIHEERGVTYLSLGVDPSPRMVITNHCLFPLSIGQSLPDVKSDIKVLEDTQALPECHIVPPQQMVHYSYHTSPDLSEPVRIRLAVAPFFSAVQLTTTIADSLQQDHDWSDAVTIATDSNPASEIIPLSMGSLVLVSSHVIGCQTNVDIELLSMDSSTNENEQEKWSDRFLSATNAKTLQKYKVKVSVKSANLSVMDEMHSQLNFAEVVSLHANNLYLLSFPESCKGIRDQIQHFHIAVNSVQVDNKAHTSGRYDFPVIFKGKNLQNSNKDDGDTIGFEELVQKLRAECFIAVAASAHHSQRWNSGGLRDLLIHCGHAEVFIEDQFIYDSLHLCNTFPKLKLKSDNMAPSHDSLPRNVACALAALKGPISLQQLTIEPITALASVHASMKFFVAVDRTSLSFGQFHTGPVFATASQLGQALSLHYSSGAIFKVGWVLGSLEILGNPAGLLRSVGSGLADTILLPYEGLIRGPTAFIAGVAGGLSSLVRQVTAGTLTSVTKFAASVSRNLDRLSLDSDHMLWQETARRRVPNRTTEGITQGLSHFGISLLGAIAGIADQPIRGFQRAGSIDDVHASTQAKEVISGFGKGLVGAVVKPIGGAAELVSQTGQGILHGTGLAEIAKQLFPQAVEPKAKFPNGRVKFAWKMLPNLSNSEILMVAKVTSITHHGLHHSSTFVLTPETLFILRNSEDIYKQALPVSQTQCLPLRGPEEGIQIVVKGNTMSLSRPEVPETSDLIADFVEVSSSFIGSIDELPNSSTEEKLENPTVASDSRTFTYLMSRHHRVLFLQLFERAKKKEAGLEFSDVNIETP